MTGVSGREEDWIRFWGEPSLFAGDDLKLAASVGQAAVTADAGEYPALPASLVCGLRYERAAARPPALERRLRRRRCPAVHTKFPEQSVSLAHSLLEVLLQLTTVTQSTSRSAMPP